jgi:hypothetical protein
MISSRRRTKPPVLPYRTVGRTRAPGRRCRAGGLPPTGSMLENPSPSRVSAQPASKRGIGESLVGRSPSMAHRPGCPPTGRAPPTDALGAGSRPPGQQTTCLGMTERRSWSDELPRHRQRWKSPAGHGGGPTGLYGGFIQGTQRRNGSLPRGEPTRPATPVARDQGPCRLSGRWSRQGRECGAGAPAVTPWEPTPPPAGADGADVPPTSRLRRHADRRPRIHRVVTTSSHTLVRSRREDAAAESRHVRIGHPLRTAGGPVDHAGAGRQGPWHVTTSRTSPRLPVGEPCRKAAGCDRSPSGRGDPQQ